MPRSLPKFLLICSLLMLAGLWLWQLRRDSTQVHPPSASEDQGPTLAPRRVAPSTSGSLDLSTPEPTLSAEPSPDETVDVRPGESIVFVADADARATLLAAARERGIPARTIDALGAIWFQAGSSQIRRLVGDEAELLGNATVAVPGTPITGTRFDLAAFPEGPLRFLGVNGDNSDWGDGVRIAVLDTGVGEHNALMQANIERFDLLGGDGADPNGHGSAVIYQLVAQDDFNAGLVPAADILSFRVLGADGTGDAFTLADGIVQAVDAGAQVINLSLGTPTDSPILRAAVEYAERQNVVLVAAVGNEGKTSVNYPAAYPEVLAVSAIDATSTIAPFANAGAVDLVAPGYGLPAGWQTEDYVYFDGTSGAAPYVAGAAAHLLSTEEFATAADIRNTLTANANELGAPGVDTATGAGSLDLDRLLRRNEAGLRDLAVADIYWPLEAADTVTPLLLVENRGTVETTSTTLAIQKNGLPFTSIIPALQPNDVHTVPFPLATNELTQPSGVTLDVNVMNPPGQPDDRPNNDRRSETIHQKDDPTNPGG